MKNRLANLTIVILLILSSCSKVENAKDKVVQKAKNKVSETTKKAWKKGVEELFEFSTTIMPSKIEDIYGKMNSEIKNQEGKRVEYIGGFYQCFFKYTAEKDKKLEFLNNLKTDHPEISDKKYLVSDRQMIDDKLSFISSKFPDIYEELTFFREFEGKDNLEYYSINKYPYSNIIIYDKKSGVIYHFVENYKD